MAPTIQIKKGFNIKLLGEAKKNIVPLQGSLYAIKPTDFIGVFPRLLVKEGDLVKAGTPLFCDKANETIIFSSPVSGSVKLIKRGEKRVLEEIIIEKGGDIYEDFGAADPADLAREQVVAMIVKAGLWPLIRQRPYNVIANPAYKPKAIFVSALDTAPLAPDYDFIISRHSDDFKAGMNVLSRLTEGRLHLGLSASNTNLIFGKNVEATHYSGPHPAGNVGVHIHHRDPINKGDLVWVVNPSDVIILGRLFATGKYDSRITLALTGSEVANPQYYEVNKGISLNSFPQGAFHTGNVRFISGNVLTGTAIHSTGFLGYYHSQLTVIPEGKHHEFFGWALPGAEKLSFSSTFLSKLNPAKKFRPDTNFHGGERALVMTGIYEKVLPMDILPMQLIKACLAEDIDLMEKLGIYEVDEEDFALAEFVDPSKTEIQSIIRTGLNLIRKEMN